MKLKTLKDLRGSCYDCGSPICETDLKQEAIKWVKRWEGFEVKIQFDQGAIQSFKLFFNITEEDFKIMEEETFRQWIQDGDKKRFLVIIGNQVYLDGNKIENLNGNNK